MTGALANGKTLLQPPLGLLDSIREKLWLYSVSVFGLDTEPPAHSGTATCVAANGDFYLLTAGHVWRAIRGADFAVALEAERLLIPIEQEAADARMVFGSSIPEWGPDVALIRIPVAVAKEIQQLKAFYNLQRPRPLSTSPSGFRRICLWAVLGAPDEQSIRGQQDVVHKLSLFETWTSQKRTKGGHDYYDLKFNRKRRPSLPRSFRGISGSGLWEIPLLLNRARSGVKWPGTVRLAGLAFYEKTAPAGAAIIRCHGPKSVQAILLAFAA